MYKSKGTHVAQKGIRSRGGSCQIHQGDRSCPQQGRGGSRSSAGASHVNSSTSTWQWKPRLVILLRATGSDFNHGRRRRGRVLATDSKSKGTEKHKSQRENTVETKHQEGRVTLTLPRSSQERPKADEQMPEEQRSREALQSEACPRWAPPWHLEMKNLCHPCPD